MKLRLPLAILFTTFTLCALARATSNYQYGPDEYVTIANGISPDGVYAITAHGEGDLGYDHFHLYLTDALRGRKIGPLEEVSGVLDTGAGSYAARWSADSQRVTIVYRIDRHAPLKAVSYRLARWRARPIKGPFDVTDNNLLRYWQNQTTDRRPSPRIFGTSLVNPPHEQLANTFPRATPFPLRNLPAAPPSGLAQLSPPPRSLPPASPVEIARRQQEDANAAAGAACAVCGGGIVTIIGVFVLLLALNIALLVWVARDAKSRGMDSSVLWMLLVMFTGLFGLIIYLFARPQGELAQCPHCKGRRLSASAICPHCQRA